MTLRILRSKNERVACAHPPNELQAQLAHSVKLIANKLSFHSNALHNKGDVLQNIRSLQDDAALSDKMAEMLQDIELSLTQNNKLPMSRLKELICKLLADSKVVSLFSQNEKIKQGAIRELQIAISSELEISPAENIIFLKNMYLSAVKRKKKAIISELTGLENIQAAKCSLDSTKLNIIRGLLCE